MIRSKMFFQQPFSLLSLILILNWVDNSYGQSSTPVPILKQINRHNEDGSYSYGYENADGSFKIETKHPTGEVFGKYGYVDVTGQLREIEYGAGRRGFEPVGTGITVPPPTLIENNGVGSNGLESDYDDGQYREDPSVYDKTPPPQPIRTAPTNNRFYVQNKNNNRYYQYENEIPAVSRSVHPRWNSKLGKSTAQSNFNTFQGHPASNVDLYSGSYNINYTT